MSYYAVARDDFSGKNFMSVLKDLVKPEVSIGNIVILFAQLSFAAAWLMNDHALTAEAQARYIDLKQAVDSLRMTLPLTMKDVDANGRNITQLQAQQISIEDRIVKLEQADALIGQMVENLRQEQRDKQKR